MILLSMKNQYSDLVDNKMLAILVIAGLSLSAVTMVIFSGDSENKNAVSALANGGLCSTGLCKISNTNTIPIGKMVLQNEENIADQSITKNNDILSIKPNKNSIYSPKISDNTITIFASKDSFIREGIQYSNEGANQVIRVMGADQTNNRALVAFDESYIDSIASGKSIESAKLRLFIVSNDERWNTNQGISAHLLSTFWSEGTESNAPFSPVKSQKGVTWDCSSDAGNCESNWNGGVFVENPSDSVKITNDLQGQWIEFDVTNDVKNFLQGTPNNGWIILKNNEDASGRINFASKESQSNIPQLVITLSA